jgi:hypothetical protein
VRGVSHVGQQGTEGVVTATVPLAFGWICEQIIRNVTDKGDTVHHVTVRMTPDALPILTERLPALWTVKEVAGVPVLWPEDPYESTLPRCVEIIAVGHVWNSAQLATAQLLADCI